MFPFAVLLNTLILVVGKMFFELCVFPLSKLNFVMSICSIIWLMETQLMLGREEEFYMIASSWLIL